MVHHTSGLGVALDTPVGALGAPYWFYRRNSKIMKWALNFGEGGTALTNQSR